MGLWLWSAGVAAAVTGSLLIWKGWISWRARRRFAAVRRELFEGFDRR